MSMRYLPFILSCLWVLTCAGVAQISLPVNSAPVAASSDASRLRQMETIYQLQLRAKHIPILSKYITDLQKLAAQASDPKPYQNEIQRIQGIISNGAVVDLAAAVQSLKTPSEMPVAQPMPALVKNSRAFIALTPALARSIIPTPSSSASPEAAAVGEIDWRIESLPAGTYDIVLNYACPSLTQPLAVQVSLAGEKAEASLDSSKTTANATTYGVMRLGQITLSAEAKGETLRLSAGDRVSSELLVKQLVIIRARAVAN